MSKQLALSTAASVLLMAGYVLFGTDAAPAPAWSATGIAGTVEITAPTLPAAAPLLPSLN